MKRNSILRIIRDSLEPNFHYKKILTVLRCQIKIEVEIEVEMVLQLLYSSSTLMTLYVRFGGVECVEADHEGAVGHIYSFLQCIGRHEDGRFPAAKCVHIRVPVVQIVWMREVGSRRH